MRVAFILIQRMRHTFRSRLIVLDTSWPVGYEEQGKLRISTIGRKTGKRHDATIWFAVNKDGRLLIATQDKRRDWVRNAAKNPRTNSQNRNVMKLALQPVLNWQKGSA